MNIMRTLHHAVLATLIAFAAGLTTAVQAETEPYKVYHVLRLADYKAATGCNTSNYARSLRSALGFLVFNDGKPNNSLQYARRHTIPLFESLYRYHVGPGSVVAEKCLPPSLRRIGFALKLLDAQGLFGTVPPLDFVYNPALLKFGQASPKAFPVMSRLDYVAKTGCKVSKKNYRRYRQGFDWVVFKHHYRKEARAGMAKFLYVLYAWNIGKDGFVQQRCMIPAISRIASKLDLLDENGRHKAKRVQE